MRINQSKGYVQGTLRSGFQAVSNGTRTLGTAITGVFLLMDVCNLLQDSVHLRQGRQTESAAELRQQVRILEGKLKKLTQIHESLQWGLNKTPSPGSVGLRAFQRPKAGSAAEEKRGPDEAGAAEC